MSRIKQHFERQKSLGRKSFIPFLSAGDPDLETSKHTVLALADLGADIIELGVPFSDPMADGPTIQRSSMRSLENGTNLGHIIAMVQDIRKRSDVPIVLFSYLNPLLNYGIRKLRDDAAAAGVDGILITDVVDWEAREIGKTFKAKDIDLISLIAPTTSDERLRIISENASGFLYAVSRAGVTGARNETSRDAEILVDRARQHTDLPIAVGFGISTREQIAEVWNYADAAVVGSAIVAEIERSIGTGDIVERVTAFVNGLVPPVAKDRVEI